MKEIYVKTDLKKNVIRRNKKNNEGINGLVNSLVKEINKRVSIEIKK